MCLKCFTTEHRVVIEPTMSTFRHYNIAPLIKITFIGIGEYDRAYKYNYWHNRHKFDIYQLKPLSGDKLEMSIHILTTTASSCLNYITIFFFSTKGEYLKNGVHKINSHVLVIDIKVYVLFLIN